jgi:hypothetical protein
VRIFISSTFEDLREYREATFAAIRSLGHAAEDMLTWSADERTPLTVSLDRVRHSDVVVLLVAHRYGTPPPGKRISITEAEYRAARDAGVPVLAFFLDESVPWPPAFIERDRRKKLTRFKTMVSTDLVRKTFTSKEDLATQVRDGFRTLLRVQHAAHPPSTLAHQRGRLERV